MFQGNKITSKGLSITTRQLMFAALHFKATRSSSTSILKDIRFLKFKDGTDTLPRLCSLRQGYYLIFSFFSYFEDKIKDEIYFENNLIKNYSHGTLINMMVKSSISDQYECTLRGTKCHCKILGDGTKQPFGNIFPKFPRASINLDCKFA